MRIHYCHEDDRNCSKWRVEIPQKALESRGHTVTRSAYHKDLPMDACNADVIVWQRPVFEWNWKHITEAQKHGIGTVVELDDLVFVPGAIPEDNPAHMFFHPYLMTEAQYKELLKNPPKGKLEPTNPKVKWVRNCLKQADLVTVATDGLAQEMKDLNKSVTVIPNCYDDLNEEWSLARQNRPAHMGTWLIFSGSMTHIGDVKLLRGVIEEIVADFPGVSLAIGGDKRLLELFDIPPQKKVYLGTKPFEQYPHLLAQGDIGLAPLADNRFNRCKSDIRLLEYGLLDIPWVASPLPAYKDWQGCGIFANRSYEWERALRRMITDDELCRNLSEKAKKKALKRGITDNAYRWVRVFENVVRKVKKVA